MLSMGFFVPEDQAVIWRGPMLHKALEQFLTDVAWGEPDYLIIDMPPGTGDVSLSMSQFLPRAEVVIVTTPQPAAQAVAQRAAAMAEKVELDVVGVVVEVIERRTTKVVLAQWVEDLVVVHRNVAGGLHELTAPGVEQEVRPDPGIAIANEDVLEAPPANVARR